MDSLIFFLLTTIVSLSFVGGLIYLIRVRVLSIGTKKEIVTALTVMGVSGIVLLLLAFA